MNENLKFGLAFAGVAIIIVLGGLLLIHAVQYVAIYTTGTIKVSELTPNPTTIDWGLVDVGVPVDRTVDFSNTGTTTVSGLTMTLDNEVGLLPSDYTCDWDYDGTDIAPEGVKTVTFTLTVNSYSNPNPDFSFEIIISGT